MYSQIRLKLLFFFSLNIFDLYFHFWFRFQNAGGEQSGNASRLHIVFAGGSYPVAGILGSVGQSQYTDHQQCKCRQAGRLPDRGVSDQDGAGFPSDFSGIFGFIDRIHMDRKRIHPMDLCVSAALGDFSDPLHGRD